MNNPNIEKALISLRGNKRAITYHYDNLFRSREGVEIEHLDEMYKNKMFDKVLDLLLEGASDSEIQTLAHTHGKLGITQAEFDLYTTCFMDTVISFSNKYLDTGAIRTIYLDLNNIVYSITSLMEKSHESNCT